MRSRLVLLCKSYVRRREGLIGLYVPDNRRQDVVEENNGG